MESTPEQERNARLQELATKSWNLELIISGAAVFLAVQLPPAVDSALQYYLNNLAVSTDMAKISLPVLAYSFGKIVAWLLIATFVVHFIMRAFWVGLVGLHAVYPAGIRYEHLPGQTDVTREQSRLRFGRLEDYITRLDRLSNQVFSFAFLIALFSLGISFTYLLVFSILHLLPLLVPGPTGKLISMILLTLFVLLACLPALALGLTKSPKLAQKPWVNYLAIKATSLAPQILLPFVYRPATYLSLTFTSNVSARRMYTTMTLVSTIAVAGVFWIFLQTALDMAGRSSFSAHSFYAQSNGAYTLDARRYDSLRSEDQALARVSIPGDIVSGPALRVFLTYPKALDAGMSQRCPPLTFPDSMPKHQRRHLADSIHLQCFSQFFQVSVNDSLYRSIDWMFHEHPATGTLGLLTYLPTKGFRSGKNVLLVKIPTAAKPDSLSTYGVVPFWFEQ
ncbi:MAG: hypothetical protein IT260_22495 [Saprospiraceae bacterium]|nr:hypothetical protein [Saprospiraceae bacterium]